MESKTFDKNRFKKRAYNLVLKTIEMIDELPKEMVSYRLSDQLLRSSSSVLANYVEGQFSISKKEFIKFFQISLKSGNESKLWLSLLKDSKRAIESATKSLIQEMDELCKILGQSLITMKKS